MLWIASYGCAPIPKQTPQPNAGFDALALLASLHVEPIAISVFPAVAMVPNTFRVRIKIAKHPDNRALCWAYDGPQHQRFCWSLAGDTAPKVETVFWFLRIPGVYGATADLTRIEFGKERHYVARQEFQVLGGFN